MSEVGRLIKIDAELFRIRSALKGKPGDKALQKERQALMKARDKVLLEIDLKVKRDDSREQAKSIELRLTSGRLWIRARKLYGKIAPFVWF